MPEAKSGDTVRVHYTGKLDDGTEFDSSLNREPLEFTLGEGQVVPGFENAVMGMNTGESKTAEIPPEEAYGPHRQELVLEVDSSELPEDLNPQKGQRLQMRQPDGQTVIVEITDVSESSITLDANHPLAGESLTFDIELVEIL
jgi:FKBP-type peptidyl-prolyl cis-trans isomerase 2